MRPPRARNDHDSSEGHRRGTTASRFVSIWIRVCEARGDGANLWHDRSRFNVPAARLHKPSMHRQWHCSCRVCTTACAGFQVACAAASPRVDFQVLNSYTQVVRTCTFARTFTPFNGSCTLSCDTSSSVPLRPHRHLPPTLLSSVLLQQRATLSSFHRPLAQTLHDATREPSSGCNGRRLCHPRWTRTRRAPSCPVGRAR